MKKAMIVILILFPMLSFAAVNDSADIIFPILDIGVGARACAMSGAFTAGADDASAVFWNSAGLSGIKTAEVAMTYESWLMNSFFGHLLAAVPLGTGVIAADVIYLNGGEFPDREQNGMLTGNNTTPICVGVQLSYGMEIVKGFSAGITSKIINQTIGVSSALGIGGDIGLLYETGIIRIGANFKNIGTGGNFSLPLSINGGVEATLFKTREHEYSIEIGSKYLFKDVPWITSGMEYTYAKMFSVRGGYTYRIGENSIGGLSGLAIGAGFSINNVRFDYAFVPYGDLGMSHKATLSYAFRSDVQTAPIKSEEKSKKNVNNAIAEANKLEKEGSFKESANVLEAAVKDNPENAELWRRLGSVYHKDKKKENAIKAFEEYLKLNPLDVKTREWLEKYKKSSK